MVTTWGNNTTSRLSFWPTYITKKKDGKMLSQIRMHLSKWSNHPLSLAGRIMVYNQVVLSSIWYLASCMDLTEKTLIIAKATIRNYIWSGKRESCARAKVKWDTAILPIVQGGVKILDPQWKASALLIKLLTRGLSVGYEPWKTLVHYRVSQTKQSRRSQWASHANWIMNSRNIVKQGPCMWQGVMRAWQTNQFGIEQQDLHNWAEITRQPIFGNRLLMNDSGIQWGIETKSNLKLWMDKGIKSLQDIATPRGYGWRPFAEQPTLQGCHITLPTYANMVRSVPWAGSPPPPPSIGQCLAPKEKDGNIRKIYHITPIRIPGSNNILQGFNGKTTTHRTAHTHSTGDPW